MVGAESNAFLQTPKQQTHRPIKCSLRVFDANVWKTLYSQRLRGVIVSWFTFINFLTVPPIHPFLVKSKRV
jgi:hypothetical protein